MDDFETKYLDVLQNLEAVIVHIDSESDDLTDLEVIDALEYLIRAFTAEANGHSAPFVRLSPLKRQIVDAVRATAEWRTRKTGEVIQSESLPPVEPEEPAASESQELALSEDDLISLGAALLAQPITMEEIVACLKRIRASARNWNASNGRRGYIEFVRQFVK